MRVPVEPTNEIDEVLPFTRDSRSTSASSRGFAISNAFAYSPRLQKASANMADLQGDFPTFFPIIVNLAQPYHISVLYSTGGGWGGNRTPDTRIFSPLLCQLSYPAFSGEEEGLRNGSSIDKRDGGKCVVQGAGRSRAREIGFLQRTRPRAASFSRVSWAFRLRTG